MHLPRLYPNEMDKVYFHQDKASSHTANLTTEYLVKMKSELGISFINKDEIPVKAPNRSPLDFFGFGYLKQRLSSRRDKTLDGNILYNSMQSNPYNLCLPESSVCSIRDKTQK